MKNIEVVFRVRYGPESYQTHELEVVSGPSARALAQVRLTQVQHNEELIGNAAPAQPRLQIVGRATPFPCDMPDGCAPNCETPIDCASARAAMEQGDR